MGIGFTYKCQCGYSIEPHYGGGFFSESYVEEEIKKGKFGSKWKEFRREHPDLKIQEDGVLCFCPSCGFFKKGFDIRFVKEIEKWEKYELIASVEVPCDKCGAEMDLYLDCEDEYDFPAYHPDWQTRRCKLGGIPRLRCPECGRTLKRGGAIDWD
ncbi:MAG: hypothetical protein IJM54_03480 [Thermoguttaceae bacterium]|nr:hypothetical protein [Thermoguttaceae bacterium]